MGSWIKIVLLLVTMASSTLALAAGDYVWEEKFARELPKAEQGDAKAQYAIGRMYEKGRGTTKNLGKAFSWYSKAANQGGIKASYKVGLAYLKGYGVKKDYAKAYTWLKKASDKDYVRAHYYLGEIYENGLGVLTDYDEAGKWYKHALEGGYDAAANGMRRVAEAQRQQEIEQQAKKLAQLKEDALRMAKAVKQAKTKQSLPAPQVSKVANKTTLGTKQRLLQGGWKKRSKDAEYLPSASTTCKDQGSRVECLSQELTRNIGMADIRYLTKAILYSFKGDGTFKVAYRNNVLDIKVTDPEFSESGGKVPVQMGWQDAEHKLTCNFEDDKNLLCRKNKLRTEKLHR